jgi:hypothetical protein
MTGVGSARAGDVGGRTGLAEPSGRGSVLIGTLFATVLLGLVSVLLADYVTDGMRSAEVTARRAESEAAATAGVQWFLEELAAKRITAGCVLAGSGAVPSVPRAVGDVEVECAVEPTVDGPPAVELVATGHADGIRRIVHVVVEVPPDEFTVRVRPSPGDAVTALGAAARA